MSGTRGRGYPTPARSATPLSDETGVPEWAFDIWEALALSIGLNFPGSLLIGLAVNATPVRAREVSRGAGGLIVAADKPDAMTIEARSIGKVPAFLLERVEPSRGTRIEVADLFGGYRDWCQCNSLDALTADAFGDELNAMTETAEIEAVRSRGRVYLLGLRLAPAHCIRKGMQLAS
jgi:hypothetical protein